MKAFTRKDICEKSGLPFTTVQLYTDKGFVIPAIHNPTGRGTNRLYDEENLIEFLLCKKLNTLGFTHSLLKKLSHQIREKLVAKKILNNEIDFLVIVDQAHIGFLKSSESVIFNDYQDNVLFLNVKNILKKVK